MSDSNDSNNTLKPFKPKQPELPDYRKGGNPLKKPEWGGHGSWRYGGGKWNSDRFKDKK